MFAFVARQPILNDEKEVFAYELLFRNGKNNTFPHQHPDTSPDSERETLKLGLDDISCQKTSFISFDKQTLEEGLPTTLDPQNVVVEVGSHSPLDRSLITTCRKIKDMGFRIAMEQPTAQEEASALFSVIDILKVDISSAASEIFAPTLKRWRDADVKLVAEHVETQKQFLACRELGFDYFQGYFFSRPESFSKKQLPSSKLSLVELVAESSRTSFNLAKVNDIFERDAGLSYMLLRFINNPMVNKRYKITSLRHALTYMGEVEVKKFIALLAMANLADDKPQELLHLSMVRAKFCDLIAKHKHIGDNPPTGFMVGLFSLLDALLDQRMQDAIAPLPVVDEVKTALCGGQNNYALYLSLVKAFESATWLKVKHISDKLGMDQRTCHSAFNEAILWGNSVRQSLSPHFPKSQVRN